MPEALSGRALASQSLGNGAHRYRDAGSNNSIGLPSGSESIPPALSPEERRQRRSGPVAVHAIGDETHLLVTDPDGYVVSVTGSETTFALMALANDALPAGDARKFTVADVAVCRIIMERITAFDAKPHLQRLVSQLCAKVAALLPTR